MRRASLVVSNIQIVESYIIAQVQMKAKSADGRQSEFFVGYAPHLVVPPDFTLLGVRVFEIEDADNYRVVESGACAKVLFRLIYHPDVDYSALIQGAEFNIQEGQRVVGTGRVLERN